MSMVMGFLSVYSNRGYLDYIPLENRNVFVTVFMMHSIFIFRVNNSNNVNCRDNSATNDVDNRSGFKLPKY